MKTSTKTTIASQLDHSSKKAWLLSTTKMARVAIFGSNVNPAITFRMKGLLTKAEFLTTKTLYETLVKREAKRLQKLYPFAAVLVPEKVA